MERGKESLAVRVERVNKSFGRRKVLSDISFDLKEGEFLSIFGPNGAGKTTLLKILSTLMEPTSGDVWVSGLSVKEKPLKIRKKIGFVSHSPLLYIDLTAYENLKFYGRMYGVERLEERIDELLEKVELNHRRYDLVGTFSRGMLQRLAIARVLLHEPEIVFLDEPHAGLDPHAVDILDSFISDLKGSHTFVMVTHNLEKGLSLSTQALILSGGEVVFHEKGEKIDSSVIRDVYRERVKEVI
ncbi:MAG: ABC transporter ATP-binding protein [Actinomycetota bacterium]